MLTLAPLPKWGKLFKAIFSFRPDESVLCDQWKNADEVAGWFARSAWSLVKIFQWRIAYTKNQRCSVWVPDYFCNSSLEPLRAIGVELSFYPLTKNMEPDYKACRKLLKNQKPDLFILTHYFGRPVQAAAAKEICLQSGAWLIEDAAHIMTRISNVGKYCDFILFSPHKVVAIPDGALLVVCPKGPGSLGKELITQFGSPKNWSREIDFANGALSIRSSRYYALIWLVKRVLQKIGIRSRNATAELYESLNTSQKVTTTKFINPNISSFALKLLAVQICEISFYRRSRQRNFYHWKAILSQLSIPLQTVNESKNREWTPYLAAFNLLQNQENEQFERLKCLTLPVLTWPDLPPEVLLDRSEHSVANSLRNSIVFFPLHHTLSDRDLYLIGQKFSLPVSSVQVDVVWDLSTQHEWSKYIQRTSKSNLLQTWEYGEAKCLTANWRVTRGVYLVNGREIAIVQVLIKKILGVFTIYRINRGPLFLEKVNQSTIQAVYSLLRSELSGLVKRRLLIHAPELELNGDSISLLCSHKYRLLKAKGWESALLDLRVSQDSLRKTLDGKWRNMLSYAERNGIRFELQTDNESFEWMLAECSKMLLTRNAGRVPEELYRSFKKQLDKTDKPMIVLKAFEGDILIAGICIVPHGVTATYLLGWNGEVGRKLNANQFLLWNAIVYLKEIGIDWFDVGGIDEEGVPGITKFKLGLNGDRYNLVGEYLCLKT